MKKIVSIVVLTLCFTVFLTSCSDDDDKGSVVVNTDTISRVFEIESSFRFDSQLGWVINGELRPAIINGDHLLIYRLSGKTGSGKDVWQLIPRTFYVDLNNDGIAESEFSYDYDFSIEDFNIYAGGSYDLTLTPELINKQVFRIVIIPGSSSGNAFSSKMPIDYKDYNAVIKYYHINDDKVIKLQPKLK